MTHDCNALHNEASQAHCSPIPLHNWPLEPDRAMLAAQYGWLTVITRREHAGRMALAAVGLFGDPDSIERLVSVLLGPDSQGGATTVVLEVRDQVSQTVAGLVPHEWSGEAADAFARLLNDQDVRDLLALAEAARNVGSPLIPLALDIRAANRRAEHAKALARAAGFDIDSHGYLNSDLLETIEHLVPGAVDHSAATAAVEEMLAARDIAEDAWHAARNALAAVQVPTIGHDTVEQAEEWGFEHAAPLHDPPPPGRGEVATGLPPTERRTNPYTDPQRLAGIRIVREHCAQIVEAAQRYGVPAEAIAGAILWEAIENPYPSAAKRLADPGQGPGKVRYFNPDDPLAPTAAQQAEDHDLVPKAGILPDDAIAARRLRLTNPDWSIVYIGAILRDSANRYEQARGPGNDGRRFDVSQDIGVLLTFYEGVDGGPEGAAARDEQRSKGPEMGNDMGPWVVDNLPWVREQLPCLE